MLENNSNIDQFRDGVSKKLAEKIDFLSRYPGYEKEILENELKTCEKSRIVLNEEQKSDSEWIEIAQDITRYIEQGLKRKEIAQKYGVSVRTLNNWTRLHILPNENVPNDVKERLKKASSRTASKGSQGSRTKGIEGNLTHDQAHRGSGNNSSHLNNISRVFPGEFYDDYSKIPPKSQSIVDTIVGRTERIKGELRPTKIAGVEFPVIFLFGYRFKGMGLFYELWFNSLDDCFQIYNRHGAIVPRAENISNIRNAIALFTNMIVQKEQKTDHNLNDNEAAMIKASRSSAENARRNSEEIRKEKDKALKELTNRVTEYTEKLEKATNVDDLNDIRNEIVGYIRNYDGSVDREYLKNSREKIDKVYKEMLSEIRNKPKKSKSSESESEETELDVFTKKIENATDVDMVNKIFGDFIHSKSVSKEDLTKAEKITNDRINKIGFDNSEKQKQISSDQSSSEKISNRSAKKPKSSELDFQMDMQEDAEKTSEILNKGTINSIKNVVSVFNDFYNKWDEKIEKAKKNNIISGETERILLDRKYNSIENNIVKPKINNLFEKSFESLTKKLKEIQKSGKENYLEKIDKEIEEFRQKYEGRDVTYSITNYVVDYEEKIAAIRKKYQIPVLGNNDVKKISSNSIKKLQSDKEKAAINESEYPCDIDYYLIEGAIRSKQDIQYLIATNTLNIYDDRSRANSNAISRFKRFWSNKFQEYFGSENRRELIIPQRNLEGGVISKDSTSTRLEFMENAVAVGRFIRGYSFQNTVNLEVWEVVYEQTFFTRVKNFFKRTPPISVTFWVFNITSASVVETDLPTFASAESAVANKLIFSLDLIDDNEESGSKDNRNRTSRPQPYSRRHNEMDDEEALIRGLIG